MIYSKILRLIWILLVLINRQLYRILRIQDYTTLPKTSFLTQINKNIFCYLGMALSLLKIARCLYSKTAPASCKRKHSSYKQKCNLLFALFCLFRNEYDKLVLLHYSDINKDDMFSVLTNIVYEFYIQVCMQYTVFFLDC